MAGDDLKKKVIALIKNNRYAKLITFGPDDAPRARIMTNLPIGSDMVIWFATGLSTNKIRDIRKNPVVCVFVDDPDDLTNISITGKAEIVTDSRLLKKYWQPPFGFFFPGGPTDPDYCLLKVKPEKVEYLDPGQLIHLNRRRVTVSL